MRSYELGNPDLDRKIRELVAAASSNGNQELIAEMITTALKLHRDGAKRGDLKLVNAAMKEIRYSMLVFGRHDEPKVTLFGSARLGEDDANYRLAMDFAKRMVERGWGVITGAGPGIMEAGSRGAGRQAAYGVSIRLPFELGGNQYLDPARIVNFKYFFTRKLGFVKESHGFALFPGGFGTLDETFELLTLVQTGKSDLHPIVLVEAPGTEYWTEFVEFVEESLLHQGLISPDDVHLYRVCTDAETAVEELSNFYSNYQSQRYVDGLLVLRLRQAPNADQLASLNQEFADIIAGEPLAVIPPTPAEVLDQDAMGSERVAFRFDRRQFGRLRQLVDRLNGLVATPKEVHPPAPTWEDPADQT